MPQPLADEDTDIFSLIRAGDVLVHHPYESFSGSVERFVRAAAEDPQRAGDQDDALPHGRGQPVHPHPDPRRRGRKQVVCLVELKARFDEERNILLGPGAGKSGRARRLRHRGAQDPHARRRWSSARTPTASAATRTSARATTTSETAQLYTDLGLLTCRPQITDDLVELFNYLTGRSLQPDYRKLLVAPVTMRDRFLEMIDREIEHHAAGRPAHIIAKMNSLEDRKIIRALYRASQAGVKIDLIVRGFCCLRPGVAASARTSA